MRHLKTVLTVLGAVTILVLAANTVAMATTGHAILAGKINTANKMTSITRTTSGTALQVKTKSTANSPFAVNGTGKVVHLNADMIDGLDSSALKSRTYVFTKAITVATSGFALAIPVPDGNYLFSYSAYMNGAGTAEVGCYVTRSLAGLTFAGESRFIAGAVSTPGLTGSGFVNKSGGATLTLNCSAGSAFTTYSGEPIQIVMTRTDVVSTSSLRVAPRAARVQH